MGKFHMGNNPLRSECYLFLSTGAVADMTSNTAEEAIDAVDNLLSMIVVENLERILKTQNQTGEDHTIEMIEEEVRYIVESQFIDFEGALCWFLTTLALQRLDYFSTEIRKRQNRRGA